MVVAPQEFFSREAAAGLDRELLGRATVLVIGAGALGQYVLDTLARCQIGILEVVDFDEFEPHNATRSPFYPTLLERQEFGASKAPTVARKLKQSIHFSDRPQLRVYEGKVEAFGDGLFAGVDVVVSCVDSASARAYISSQCKRHRKPLVEGGIGARSFNVAVFGSEQSDPCWNCFRSEDPHEVKRQSCLQFARAVEQAGLTPTTPIVAQIAGGAVAGAVVQLLHEAAQPADFDNSAIKSANRIVFGDVLNWRVTEARLTVDPNCHRHARPLGEVQTLGLSSRDTVADLLRVAGACLDLATIRLPHPFVLVTECMASGRLLDVHRPAWAVPDQPISIDDGGSFSLTAPVDNPRFLVAELSPHDEVVHDLHLCELGLHDGSVLDVWDQHEQVHHVQLGEFDRDLFALPPVS